MMPLIQRKSRLPLLVTLIFILYFVPVSGTIAAEKKFEKGPITIEANSIAYDKDKDTYTAKENVFIVFSGGFLMAESVILDRISNDAFAQGYVLLISDNDILEGDRVKFNIESKTGIAYEGKMFLAKNHFYLTGSKIEKTGEATYHINDATATTCDGDSPDWKLKGSELDVTIDGYGTLKHSEFLAKNLPIFYTPYLFFPAKTTRQSGFLFPYLSSSKKLGYDVELPFFWAISDSADATLYQRYMVKRGFKEGMEFRYFISKNSFGTFYADFINDTWHGHDTAKTAGGRSRDWQSDHKRWSYYLNHETAFSPSFNLRTDIRKVSDEWYFKDFSSHNYYLENYSKTEAHRFEKVPFKGDESLGSLDSTVRLVKNWQLYNLTSLVRYTDDFASATNDATLQKYPEISLKGIKRPLFGTLLNFELDTAYDYYYRNEGQKGHHYDVQPVLSLPLSMSDYLKVTPWMGAKGTFWNRDDSVDTGSMKGNRDVYSMGATATTEIARIFDIGGRDIDKIRHSIKPEISYTYIPYAEQNDAPDFVVRIPEQNTITYALTNTLIAKLKEPGGGKSYREFLRLKLAQTYDIKESRRDSMQTGNKRPFSDINMELDIKPFQYLSFSARNKYDVTSGGWTQANYDFNVSDWRGDSATLGYRYARSVSDKIDPSASNIPFSTYRYTQSALEEINLSLKAMITKNTYLLHVLRRNELDNKIVERTYGLVYGKQCWNIELKYTETDDDTRFTVGFSLYGLGKVGGK
jgi:LPS-assembly protein